MNAINGHDLHLSQQLVQIWNGRRVRYRNREFLITKEMISSVTGLHPKGMRFFKINYSKKEEETKFLEGEETLIEAKSGFLRESLPKPYDK
ncbi:hypothetical protein KI387_023939, partial [Taxus chinensis]